MFQDIRRKVEACDPYFRQKLDCCEEVGASSYQKVVEALIRVLTYAASADQLDEYIRLGETTILDMLEKFRVAVIDEFRPTYLRMLTKEDLELIPWLSQREGFIGCLGCCKYWMIVVVFLYLYYSNQFCFFFVLITVDVMKWEWKNCPMSWRDSFTNMAFIHSGMA